VPYRSRRRRPPVPRPLGGGRGDSPANSNAGYYRFYRLKLFSTVILTSPKSINLSAINTWKARSNQQYSKSGY